VNTYLDNDFTLRVDCKLRDAGNKYLVNDLGIGSLEQMRLPLGVRIGRDTTGRYTPHTALILRVNYEISCV
jgi:hypothetical protein